MRWRSVILLAGVVIAASALKRESRSRFTSVEDEEEEDRSGHLFDVKKIVKGTIDAIGGQGTTAKPDSLYQLFQIPSEILTQIAADAGYMEPEATTKKPRRKHSKKYRKISEDGEYEGTYVRVADSEGEEEDDGYKPKKKNKSRRHHRPIYLDPSTNYVPRPMIPQPSVPAAGAPLQQLQPQQQPVQQQQQPLSSLFAPLPAFPVQQLPSMNLPTFSPTPVVPTMAPLSIQPVADSLPKISVEPAQTPEYGYQPIITPDGKTYYQRVLILPPTKVGQPETVAPTTTTTLPPPPSTTTTPPPAPTSFLTDAPTTTTLQPETTTQKRRRTKIRRRLIKTTTTESPAVQQQLPQSDVPVAAVAAAAAAEESTTMRPIAITFSPNLELFKTTTIPSELVGLQEQREVKIKPRTHGTRTHAVGKAIESGDVDEGEVMGGGEQKMKYVKIEEEPTTTTSSSIPTPPTPSFTPRLITNQLATKEEQMKNNEVFSASMETKRGDGLVSVPQVTPLHSITTQYLKTDEERKKPKRRRRGGRKGGRKEKKEKKEEKVEKEEKEEEKKEERVKKVDSDEIDDIKVAVEAARREKKNKKRIEAEDEIVEKKETKKVEEEKEEEEEVTTTTEKPKKKRRSHRKKSRQPKKIDAESPGNDEEPSIPSASPSTASFRRSLTPALIDVRDLNDDDLPRTNSPTIRHIHHAERLAVLRRTLEARARGVKSLTTHDKERYDEDDEESERIHEGEEVSKPLTDLTELFPSTTTEVVETTTVRRRKTRRNRKRKSTTAAPTTTTTTTTTTESPSTTTEKKKEEEASYELSGEDEEYQEDGDISFEVDENGDKIVINKKKVAAAKTTTETPTSTSTAAAAKKLKVLRPHCLNIRSFARQFGMADTFAFVEEHCSFIENYYPTLTCERREEYLSYCAGVWDSTKL